MIIDCHSHIWSSRESLGLAAELSCLASGQIADATVQAHQEACEPAEVAVVLGFISNLLNAEISNEAIKRYAADHAGRVIAFAGIDPIAVLDIQEIINELKKRTIGVLISDHNVRETLGVCDRAYILNEGCILEHGSPEAIAQSAKARAIYLGENFRL